MFRKKKKNKTNSVMVFSEELRILEGKCVKNVFQELKAETFSMPLRSYRRWKNVGYDEAC